MNLTRCMGEAMLRTGKSLELTRYNILAKPQILGQARQNSNSTA